MLEKLVEGKGYVLFREKEPKSFYRGLVKTKSAQIRRAFYVWENKNLVARPANTPCGFTTAFCKQKRWFAYKYQNSQHITIFSAFYLTPRKSLICYYMYRRVVCANPCDCFAHYVSTNQLLRKFCSAFSKADAPRAVAGVRGE